LGGTAGIDILVPMDPKGFVGIFCLPFTTPACGHPSMEGNEQARRR